MRIYQGPYLTINFEKENDRFVQFWSNSPNCVDSFKAEMIKYTSFYEVHRPSQSLWLHQNFTLQLDDETFLWIEKNVNIPCFEFGNKKAAFVVGKDVLVHLAVIDSFEKAKSIIKVGHFASEKEAISWLDKNTMSSHQKNKTEITFEGVDQNGNSIIQLKSNSKNISSTIKSFRDLIEENDFIKTNIDKYALLTKREKEVLKLMSTGKKHQEISDQLFLSLHTVRTHWRNIKEKLQITSFNEIIKYTKAFNL